VVVPALRDLQASFWRALASGEPDVALLDVVRAGGRLTPAERVGIYTDMYRWRIVDTMRDDFPRTAACLGPEDFQAVAARYLAAHPSGHPSLRHVGGRFAEFLADDAIARACPWAPDVARLEWTRLAVFDAPDASPLTVADLRGIAADAWPALRFALVPACETLVTAWPIAALWGADGAVAVALAPARSAFRIWRAGFEVFHVLMEPAEEAALAQLAAGRTFAEICEGFESAADAAALLLRWVEDGLVARAG
jgi:hypothetical protein